MKFATTGSQSGSVKRHNDRIINKLLNVPPCMLALTGIGVLDKIRDIPQHHGELLQKRTSYKKSYLLLQVETSQLKKNLSASISVPGQCCDGRYSFC